MMMRCLFKREGPTRRAVTLIASSALAAAAIAPVLARADGLPVLGIDVGASGVASRAGDARYVTLDANHATLAARIDPHSGRVLSSTLLPGSFTIPAVAYDASAGGLSADGKRLALIEPRQHFPRPTTRLMLLRAPILAALPSIVLHGDFSFDAISPDGTRLYLIQYTSPSDPTRYLVRAYDTTRHRLLAGAIRDPSERGDSMRGSPITRTMSTDGRWAYTLYDGAGGTPFIHTLDTQRGVAHCIDLPSLAAANLSGLHLHAAETTLSVQRSDTPVATIDLHTFHAVAPASAATHPDQPGAKGPIGWIATLSASLAAITVIVRWRTRKTSATRGKSGPARLT